MKRTTRTLALTWIMVGSLFSSESVAQRAPRTPRAPRTAQRSCIQVVQENAQDGHGITFELTNRCDTAIESTVTWRIACGRGGEASPVDHHTSLAAHEQRVVVADASVCGAASWRIDDVHWAWTEAPAESIHPVVASSAP